MKELAKEERDNQWEKITLLVGFDWCKVQGGKRQSVLFSEHYSLSVWVAGHGGKRQVVGKHYFIGWV